jgi:hypothetical protein
MTIDKKFLSNFKMGIFDALFIGNMRYGKLLEIKSLRGYKQGYDFGISLYSDFKKVNI